MPICVGKNYSKFATLNKDNAKLSSTSDGVAESFCASVNNEHMKDSGFIDSCQIIII